MTSYVVRHLRWVFLAAPLLWSSCGRGPTAEEAVREATVRIEQGRVQEAINLLQEFEEGNSGNADVAETLAFAHAQIDEPMMAAFYFNQVASLRPDQPEYLLYSAQSMVEAGDGAGAIELYQQYLEQRPEDSGALVALGEIAGNLGRAELAISSLTKAYEQRVSTDVAMRLGQLFLQQGNLAQAELWLKLAEQTATELRPEVLLGQIEIALRQKRFSDASGLVRQIEERFPGRLAGSSLRDAPAQLKEWQQRQDEALNAAAALTQPSPQAEQPAQPAPAQEAAREVPPASRVVESEDLDESGEIIVNAPSSVADAERLRSKADALAEAEAALNALQEPLPTQAASEQTAPAALEQARAARAAGNTAEAARLYRQLLASIRSGSLWNEYSELVLEIGDADLAQSASLEAMRLAPDEPVYALQFLKATQEAQPPLIFMQELLRMRQRFPNSPEVALALARGYWRIENNARNARLLYQEFLEKRPNHPLASEARAELNRLPR